MAAGEADDVPEGFGRRDAQGHAAAAQQHGYGVELAAGAACGAGVSVKPEIAALGDDFHQGADGQRSAPGVARGGQDAGVGAEVADGESVEQGGPARDAEVGAGAGEFVAAVAARECGGCEHVVADLAQADAGAEGVAHDVDVDEQQLEQGRRRGKIAAAGAAGVAPDQRLEAAARPRGRKVDQAGVELDGEAVADERAAAVGVSLDRGAGAADDVKGGAHLTGPEPQVDVAALAELGRRVVACHRQALLHHRMKARRAEGGHERADGGAHAAVGGLDGVDAGNPARQQRGAGQQRAGQAAVGGVADAAHGLAPGQGVDCLPVGAGEADEQLLSGRGVSDAAAYQLHECCPGACIHH